MIYSASAVSGLPIVDQRDRDVILAGDIGGTNTRLALFQQPPPAAADAQVTYASRQHSALAEMLDVFLEAHPAQLTSVSFGVAGPVTDGKTESVNLAWTVDAAATASALGVGQVGLINDLEANAWGIAALGPSDFAVLNEGEPVEGGNVAVISAGTGLGEAGLIWDGGRYVPFASEGGHVDFAPRTEQEADLWRHVVAKHGRASVERVCSGGGLVTIYEHLLEESGRPETDSLREARAAGDAAPTVSRTALADPTSLCGRALSMMVSIYGAEAGNLALKVMATGGVYVGGGIAPKILSVLQAGEFMDAFAAKGRLGDLLEQIPVRVILNEFTALYGAALHAASRLPAPSA